MPNLDRRKLLHAGIALAVPLSGLSLLGGCQQSAKDETKDGSGTVGSANSVKTEESVVADESDVKPKQESKEKNMQIQYLEIVTSDADALCNQYSAIHGVTFSDPVAEFGNARTAKLNGGGQIAIRGPLRETETPVIRPYVLVEDIKASVAAAAEAGAEIAIPSMELPGHGTIAVVIQGGIECGLWQN